MNEDEGRQELGDMKSREQRSGTTGEHVIREDLKIKKNRYQENKNKNQKNQKIKQKGEML